MLARRFVNLTELALNGEKRAYRQAEYACALLAIFIQRKDSATIRNDGSGGSGKDASVNMQIAALPMTIMSHIERKEQAKSE